MKEVVEKLVSVRKWQVLFESTLPHPSLPILKAHGVSSQSCSLTIEDPNGRRLVLVQLVRWYYRGYCTWLSIENVCVLLPLIKVPLFDGQLLVLVVICFNIHSIMVCYNLEVVTQKEQHKKRVIYH